MPPRGRAPAAIVPVDPPVAPANAKLAGSVLVWIDAPFYLAPRADAPSLQFAQLDARKDRVGHAVPMRVVAARGAFVEVETPVLDDLHNTVTDCAWHAIAPANDLGRLRLFVRRSDLAP